MSLVRRTLPSLSAVAFLSALALAPSIARAEDPSGSSAERTAAAKALFDQAQALMEKKSYRDACSKFAASNLQVTRVGTLLNLGDCYEKNGQNASAWATYNDAINLGRRQGRPELEEFARKKVTELEPHLVHLTIKVPKEAAVDGLAIQRDGVAIDAGAWEAPIPIDPGAHEMTVSAPKKIAKKFPIRIDEAAPNTDFVVSALEDAPIDAPQVRTKIVTRMVETPTFWSTPRTIGLVVGGVGIATLIGGAATGAAAAATWSSAKSSCAMRPDGLCVPGSDAPRLTDTATTLATASTVLFIAGGVITAGGVVLFLLGGSKKPAETPPPGRVSVTPSLAPGYAGVGVSGTW
ncbi:hypothetical protein BH09MYX1_BH09MYX1_33210 [soil metagenome]